MAEKRPSLLIVDDEFNTRETLLEFLGRKFDAVSASNGSDAIKLLQEQDFELILTDLRMPEADGMSVLEAAAAKACRPTCIMMTAYGSITDAVQAMKNGAFDFIAKPIKLAKLEEILAAALKSRGRIEEKPLAAEQGKVEKVAPQTNKLVIPAQSGSTPMRKIYEKARTVAGGKSTVLLLGESGTGKEVIARYIHDNSGRTGLFVPVHCAALTSTLLEDELFGHEKGAFTNAISQRRGRFELADHGTIFLDEIGEIDAATQVKLLRVLETREFERLGGTETVKSDFRLIAATNRDLKSMVDKGEFREDLYYRLSVVDLHLPPLRERREEIPELVSLFIREFAAENMKDVSGITSSALEKLCAAPWYGNIRELRNCVEKMVVLSSGKMLDDDDVPFFESAENISKPEKTAADPLNLENSEKELIRKALAECGNNRTAAAKKLGISRRTLYRKLEEMDTQGDI